MSNNSKFDVVDEQMCIDALKGKLKNVVHRISWFKKKYKKWSENDLKEIYGWFLDANLLDLYAFSDWIDINNDEKALNKNNPFCVWTHKFNTYKHIDAERDETFSILSYINKFPKEVKFKFRKKYSKQNIQVTNFLVLKFYDKIQNDKFSRYSIEIKINEWDKISDFLKYILDLIPNSINEIKKCGYFNDIKFELYKHYQFSK